MKLTTNMKRYLVLTLITLFHLKSFSQNVEHLMTKRHIDCPDIILNAASLIPDHFEKNHYDTVAAVMNYWEGRCGVSEPLFRLKILFAVNADTLNENLCNTSILMVLLNQYRERIRRKKQGLENYGYVGYYSLPVLENLFDSFTLKLALQLKQRSSNSELDRFFIDFYANDFDEIFLRLQNDTLEGSKLKEAYDNEIDKYIHLPEGHFSIYSGIWIPVGNIRVVGNHPIIGLQGGFKNTKGLLVDAALEFKFGSSPNTYFVEKNDSLYSTTHFFGGFFGIEVGYELAKFKSQEIDLLGGIGWDGFDALSIGEQNDPDRVRKSINALNLNVGIGYRKYLKNKSYIGIETRYNFVDYRNRNGTDLTGNTLTLRVKYGISRNWYRDSNLKRLDHRKILSDENYYKWLHNGRRNFYQWY